MFIILVFSSDIPGGELRLHHHHLSGLHVDVCGG